MLMQHYLAEASIIINLAQLAVTHELFKRFKLRQLDSNWVEHLNQSNLM